MVSISKVRPLPDGASLQLLAVGAFDNLFMDFHDVLLFCRASSELFRDRPVLKRMSENQCKKM